MRILVLFKCLDSFLKIDIKFVPCDRPIKARRIYSLVFFLEVRQSGGEKGRNEIQSTLGFETLDKAAALGLETAPPMTDPRQYINSNLGFSNLKI